MATSLPQCTDILDPRVRRTRQMLEQALEKLLREKSYHQISVGEIAQAATVNRATFYDHFLDKSDLLESLVRSCFHDLIERRGLTFDGQCSSALTGIALAVCDYLVQMPDHPDQRAMDQSLELALVAVIRGLLLTGLQQHPSRSGLPPEVIAGAMAGAIYGSAREWLRMPERPSAPEFAKDVMQLISPMLAPRG